MAVKEAFLALLRFATHSANKTRLFPWQPHPASPDQATRDSYEQALAIQTRPTCNKPNRAAASRLASWC